MSKRYAIYYTPDPGSELNRFGAEWLGWDSAAGQTVPHAQVAGLDLAAITERPRKYGFHGTIKPPFHLAQGATEQGLRNALADMCTQLEPVWLDGLALTHMGRFLALTPMGSTRDLAAFAAHVVRGLDSYRAPASDDEIARRRARSLSPEQERNLADWGYPYVMDAFRFHMTLTGPLDPDTATQAEHYLTPRVLGLRLSPWLINSLTLLGSDEVGRFRQLQRFSLSG